MRRCRAWQAKRIYASNVNAGQARLDRMTNNNEQGLPPNRGEARARRGEPRPQLFSDRADRRRTGRRHLVADLVVRHLGRQSGAAVHSGDVPAGNLSAGPHSGARSDHRLCGADLARLPHRQPGRPQAGRSRRKCPEPHADRAADLPHRQADFSDAVFELRHRASAVSAWSSSRRPACGRWCS